MLQQIQKVLMYLFFAGFLSVFAMNCSHAPKLGGESGVESLNGKNYQAPVGGVSGSLGVREGSSITRISGELVIKNKLPIPEPLKFQKLMLMKDGVEVARTVSDSAGLFKFSGEIANGAYVILLESARYKVAQPLTVDRYVVDHLQVFAIEK